VSWLSLLLLEPFVKVAVVGIPDGCIVIDGAVGNVTVLVAQAEFVELSAELDVDIIRRFNIRVWHKESICNTADRVSGIGRSEKRPDDVGSAGNSPACQSLGDILVIADFFDLAFVDGEDTEPNHGIRNAGQGIILRFFSLSLHQVADEADRSCQVVEKVEMPVCTMFGTTKR